MCELNLLVGCIGKREHGIISLMMNKSIKRGNRDGWGVLTNRFLARILGDESEVVELRRDKREWFVIGHCRLASAGTISIENTQPIRCGDVVVAHHGHLAGMVRGQDYSDTHKLAMRMGNVYRDTHDFFTVMRVLDGEAWYSCFVYFVDEDRLFYVRDEIARFYFGAAHIIAGATARENAEIAGVKDAVMPRAHEIYEITRDGVRLTGSRVKRRRNRFWDLSGWEL